MRRFIVILALIAVLLATIAAPVSAVPVSDLTALARYMPSGTEMLIASRTDDGFIETLDSVLARLGEVVPSVTSGGNLSQALEQVSSTFPGDGDTYDTVFGPWLGDTIAMGIISLDPVLDDKSDNDDDVRVIVAVEHTSREAAVTFFSQALELDTDSSPDYEVVDEGAYTLFVPNSSFNPIVFVDDSVLLVTNANDDAVSFGSLEQSLATDALFTDAIAQLPLTDYNVLVYQDVPALFNSLLTTMRMADDSIMGMTGFGISNADAFVEMFDGLGDAYGGLAWGFTILDGRSLVMDIGMQVDVAALNEISPEMSLTYGPLNLDFARYIPAGTPLVIHGANLASVIQSGLANVGTQMEMMGEEMDAEQLQAQINLGIQGFLGMPADEAFAWMTGDYALVLGVSPALGDVRSESDLMNLSVFPVDFGFIVDASGNPEAAQEFASGLTNSLTLFSGSAGDDVQITQEEIAGTTATVIRISAPDLPMPIELVIGANENVFVLGTPDVAEAAFAGDGGLPSDAQFVEALSYALPNPSSLAYAAGAGLQPLADLVRTFDRSSGEGFQAFVSLLSSSSVSVTTDNASQYQVRAVITLP